LFSQKDYAVEFTKHYNEFTVDGKSLVAQINITELIVTLVNFMFHGGRYVIIDEGQSLLGASIFDMVNACYLELDKEPLFENNEFILNDILLGMKNDDNKLWTIPSIGTTNKDVINNQFVPLKKEKSMLLFTSHKITENYIKENKIQCSWIPDLSWAYLIKVLLYCYDQGERDISVIHQEIEITISIDKLFWIMEQMNKQPDYPFLDLIEVDLDKYQNEEGVKVEENLDMDIATENSDETNEDTVKNAENVEKSQTPIEERGADLEAVESSNYEEIISKIDRLQESFDESIKYDKYKDELFDNLHKELTQYKNGVFEKVIDNMAMDLIRMIDTTKKTISLYEKKEFSEDNYRRLLSLFEGVAEDLQDILYRQSIEAYSVHGNEVDVKQQKIISKQETSDESLNNKVAARLADGYEKNGKVLRPERISIYKYKADKGEN